MTITRKCMFAAAIALSMLGVGSAFASRSDSNLTPLQTTGTYSESFENLTAWGGAYTNVAITNGWYSDFPGGSDQSAITNMPYTPPACGYPLPGATHTNVLQLNTQGAMLTNSFGTGFNMANAVTYMDTMVQFVPQGDLTPPSACTATDNGIKLAVYVNSNTNLVIYHGVLNGGSWDHNTNDVISAFTLSTSAWYRLTIAFDATCPYDATLPNVEMFQVLTNGVAVQSPNAYDSNWNTQYWEQDQVPPLSSTGTWFRSATAPNGTVNKTLYAIAFQGTGFIDDLVVSTNAPTGSGPSSYLLSVVTDGNGSANGFASPLGSVTVAAGTSTNIVFNANQWFQIASLQTNGVAVAGSTGLTNYTLALSNIQGNISNNVTFTRPTYTVAVSVTGSGTSAGGSSLSVLNGMTATNSFSASAPWYLVTAASGGSVSAGGINADNITLVTGPVVDNSLSQSVTFDRPTRTITLSPLDHATGPTSVLNGQYATNVFTADPYFLVSTVSGDGSTLTGGVGNNSVTLTAGPITNNISETVTFTRPIRHITQIVGANGSANPATNDIQVLNGLSTSIVYTASQWFEIASLTTNGLAVAGAAGQTNLELDLNFVQADFSNNVAFFQPTNTVAVNVTGGTSAGGALIYVLNGGLVTNSFTTSPWWLVTAASGGSIAAGGTNADNITLVTGPVADSTSTQSVTFVRPTRTITLNPLDHVTGVATTNVLNGDFATNTFTADTYFFVNTVSDPTLITAGGTGDGNSSVTLTAGPVTNDFNETVTFFQPTRTITIGSLANGSANPSGPIYVLNGNSTSVLFTANDWYKVATVSPNGTPGGKTATATFTTVLADAIANATFITNITGAVVANVPSSWALGLGLTESYAVANSNAMQQGYMLNINPTALANPTLSIAGIGVSGSSVNVTVLLDNNNAPTNTQINGQLWVYATNTLSAGFTSASYKEALATASFTNGGKHVFTFTDAKSNDFYKAVITP